MPEYEIEWTETHAYKARIHAPNDDMILANGGQDAIHYAKSDVMNGAGILIGTGSPVREIKSIGRVVQVVDVADPNFPDIASTHEEVQPL